MSRSIQCISLAALLCAAGLAAEPGRNLYREGVLPSGARLRGELPGGVVLEGTAAACASCHRRSGYGGVEGQVFVPPVTAATLFQEQTPRRAELFGKLYQEDLSLAALARLHNLGTRPAYTAETLAAALRDGRDPSGRPLAPLMPRYRLDDRALADLSAYLRTLAATAAPGVDEREIHFATVFTPGADPGARQAVLGVMEAFFRRKNADVARVRRQAPLYKEDAAAGARRWVLHVWDLAGPPESWPGQLAGRYREQPVFAVLSGAGGTWAPVHAFCESEAIPCLFPETDLPPAEPGAYALYFSPGLTLEAETLGRYLRDLRETAPAGGTLRVVQVFHPGEPRSAGPVAALRHALAIAATVRLEDREPADLPDALRTGRPDAVVLWLSGEDLAKLPAPPAAGPVPRLVLSRSLLGETPPPLPATWSGHVLLIDRFAPPGAAAPHGYRARAWLRACGLAPSHERLQLDTWFTLSLTEAALMHLVDNFSRDYFIESVERETERVPNPGVYTRLSLKPGQRFASKACAVRTVSDVSGTD